MVRLNFDHPNLHVSLLVDWSMNQFLFVAEEMVDGGKSSISSSSFYSFRSHVNRHASSLSSNYSQRICIQLQITISLIAISICFIFRTLPNCISTIMIQQNNQNEDKRRFWQALNYLSIVPLLITHSVNVIFYYLSSNMFRSRFKENFF